MGCTCDIWIIRIKLIAFNSMCVFSICSTHFWMLCPCVYFLQIAFVDLNPFPRKKINELRCKHQQELRVGVEGAVQCSQPPTPLFCSHGAMWGKVETNTCCFPFLDVVEAHATATNFLWGIWAIHVAKRKLIVEHFDRKGLHQLQNFCEMSPIFYSCHRMKLQDWKKWD